MLSEYSISLVTPQPTKTVITRRVKSFDVEMLRLFAVATNVEGKTSIPLDAIGAPYRLATNKDGTIRFGQTGKPSVRIAKELVGFGTMIHQNIVAGIQADTARVFKENEEACTDMLAKAEQAGKPIVEIDERKLAEALKARAEAVASVPERELVPA